MKLTSGQRWVATRAFLIAILWCFLGQVLYIAGNTSLTIDEGLHLASGYTIWRTGDYRLVEEHPPFAKLWLTLPLLPITELEDPAGLPAWNEAETGSTDSLPLINMTQQLLYPSLPVDGWLFPARAMAALLGILLLAIIYRWTQDLFGIVAALVIVTLASLDPNLLAHSAIAGTDLAAALVIALALRQTRRFLVQPTYRAMVLLGLVMGIALATKLTALVLVPTLLPAALGRWWFGSPLQRRRLIVRIAGAALIGGMTFWAIYGFQVGMLPGFPFPLPATAHALPILRLRSHMQTGHEAYLLGENRLEGWRIYFPIALLIKSPLPALLLWLAGLSAVACRWLARRHKGGVAALLSPPLIFGIAYGASSLLSSLNIGYRHLLPLLPLLYVAGGAAVAPALRKTTEQRWLPSLVLVGILSIWQAGGTLRHSPHLLAYFNELVGGPSQGWRYLADSNTDWGQGYKALADAQASGSIPGVRLSAFVFYDAALYGVDYEALPPLGRDSPPVFPSRLAPPPGHYAISVTPLNGIPTTDPEMYDWFRWREPDATLAYVLRYYHVTAEETSTAWLAQCSQPVVPLDSTAIEEGFGQQPPRMLTFDCLQSWIYPASGSSAGVYAVHGVQFVDTLRARLHYAPPPVQDGFLSRHLGITRISFRQRAYRSSPAFALYRSGTVQSVAGGRAWTADANSPISKLDSAALQSPPFDLAGPLRFLGAESYHDSEGLEVETWWEVTQPADGRPISLMAHLLAADGTMLGVADGLGVHPTEWEVGDIVVQRHRFAGAELRSTNGETLILRTGAYWADTGERWAVLTGPQGQATTGDAIFVELPAR